MITKLEVGSARYKVLAVAGRLNLSINEIRLIRPLCALVDAGHATVRFRTTHDITLSDVQWSDIVVLQRDADRQSVAWLVTAHKLGKAIVYEIDDLLTEHPPHLIGHTGMKANERYVRAALDIADVVSTSTQRLRMALGVDPQKIRVVPNYAEPNGITPAQHVNPRDNGQINLVLAASDRMYLNGVLSALGALQRRRGAAVQIHAIGPIAERLTDAIPGLKVHPNMALGDFRMFLSSLINPIGLIPLDGSRFSSCKSAVKYFDYAMCGVVSICSNVPPYSDVITDGHDGYLVENDDQAWLRCIEHLADNWQDRIKICAAARGHVAQHYTLQANTQALEGVIARAGAITAERHLTLSLRPTMRRWILLRATAYSIFQEKIRAKLRRVNRARLERRRRVDRSGEAD